MGNNLTIDKKVIKEVISSLGKERKIFHSEDDFKFSFSQILSKKLGDDFELRLERPIKITMINRDNTLKDVKAPIDIMILDTKNNISYPIELKYKTKKLEVSINGEDYNLSDQSARDVGRFSFRKDIFRVEQVLKNHGAQTGFFIVITNDINYPKDVSNKNTLDCNFSFHKNMILKKYDKSWNYDKLIENGYILNKDKKLERLEKEHWTSKGGYFFKLDLKNEYEIKWEDYSEINNHKFFISIIEIKKGVSDD